MDLEEKYSPISLDELNFGLKLNEKLTKISEIEIPNLLICGPHGSGKYTRILLTLKKHLKSASLNVKPKAIDVDSGQFTSFDKKRIICAFISEHHCEIELLQQHAQKALIPFVQYYSKTKNIKTNKHKYLILKNFEVLSNQTQNALRTIVEKNHSRIRFLVTLSRYSKLIPPLRSRFVCFNLKAPTILETTEIINIIFACENYNISKHDINKIIKKLYIGSFNAINLKELFLVLEGTIITKNIYTSQRNLAINNFIKLIKSGNRSNICKFLYELYEKNEHIFIDIIFHDFYRKILPRVKDKHKFKEITAKWEAIIAKDFISNKILIAEGYAFDICHFLDV